MYWEPVHGAEVSEPVGWPRPPRCRSSVCPLIRSSVSEKAREFLHQSGRFIVVGGIISPVHDSYGKPVSAGGVAEEGAGQAGASALSVTNQGVCACVLQGLVSSRHRLTMCQLAVQSSDWIR